MPHNESLAKDLRQMGLVPESFIEAFLENQTDDAMREMRLHLEGMTDEEIEALIAHLEAVQKVLPQIALYIKFAQRARR